LPVGQHQTQVFYCVRFSGDHLPVNSDREFSPFRRQEWAGGSLAWCCLLVPVGGNARSWTARYGPRGFAWLGQVLKYSLAQPNQTWALRELCFPQEMKIPNNTQEQSPDHVVLKGKQKEYAVCILHNSLTVKKRPHQNFKSLYVDRQACKCDSDTQPVSTK
jgi:hypothetical protein